MEQALKSCELNRMRKCIFVILIACLVLPFTEYSFNENEEKEFVLEGLVQNLGTYTLLGDKPVSTFVGVELPKFNLELFFRELEDFVWYTLGWVRSKNEDRYKRAMDWKFWKRRNRLNSRRFCLVEQKCSDAISVTFVNKTRVQEVLEEHYHLLVEQIGMDFDICEVMKNIHIPKSFFWTYLMGPKAEHISIGLFYGFGLDNSQKFQQRDLNPDLEKSQICLGSYELVEGELNVILNSVSGQLEDLPLPMYMAFSNPDPVLEHYKQERARIQQEYKDADLHQLFLNAFE